MCGAYGRATQMEATQSNWVSGDHQQSDSERRVETNMTLKVVEMEKRHKVATFSCYNLILERITKNNHMMTRLP